MYLMPKTLTCTCGNTYCVYLEVYRFWPFCKGDLGGGITQYIICLTLNSTFSIRDAYIWIPWPQKHTFLDTATNILDDI